ncbi:MAG: sulfatase-like hydrolase/transferase [Planctomycetes bacterium]|nr:sulfatase-like hydrolase/transferase [Planctomycetota bacterium]
MAMSKQKNILLFLTDDQRFDAVGALGNSEIKTPHLDALIARGTAFTRAHIPGGTCGAVCMPSRAMLHSGRTLFHIDGEGETIPRNHTTLGEHLRHQGYATCGIGKWHNEREAFARSFSEGDEIFFGGMSDHWNVPAYRFDPGGRYEEKRSYIENPWYSNEVKVRHCDHIEAGRHSTDLFVEAAIGQLRKRAGDPRPFFMYVALMAPHDPRSMPRKYLELYDPDKIALPANFLEEHPIDTFALKVRDELLAAFPRNPAEIRRHIAEYYAMITHLDDAFGRLVAALEEEGELDNTIIAFAGDNGLAIGQHGLMGKQCLYEHSVRVPLVFAGPGVPEGQRREDLVYLLDIFPTLCELTGLPIPASVEGRSLVPGLRGESSGGREQLYLAYSDGIRGLSDGSYKLIEYACGATQLFDLQADPLEMENLAQKAERQTQIASMRAKLRQMALEWGDEEHPKGRSFWSYRPDLR